jgi:predicted CXXCH cytochrome family protein
VGLQATGVRGNLQDISQWPDFDAALDAFEAGTVLNYYNCPDATSGFSHCRVSEGAPTEPGATVWFTVELNRNEPIPVGQPGAYSLTVTNVINGADPNSPQTYDVDMTYGGAVHKQRYMTRFDNDNGTSSYYLLMVQYNYEGDTSFPSSNNWPWRDYHSERWYDFTGQLLIEPAKSKAFDNNCAGCHFNAFRIEGSEADGWAALTVPDPNGAMDFDGDGRLDEINTGCEACHGPGSEHLEDRPQGGYIVSPSLLTPGRELMICGRCHSRPQGLGAGMTDAPLSEDNLMALPGTRRADFALNYTNRVDGKTSNFFPTSLDSSSHHQQYSDFIRSHHYRNPFGLLTCTSCHDPHGNDENESQLLIAAENNTICTQCHTDAFFPPIGEHVLEETGFGHDVEGVVTEEDFLCVTCHMVGTATSGAQSPQLVDDIDDDPPVEYFWGDIAGHRFEARLVLPNLGGNPELLVCDKQPVAATNECATCHRFFLPPALPAPCP